MERAALAGPRRLRALPLTKLPPKVAPHVHDFEMSGVTLDGEFWRECRCGWRTPNCHDLSVAGDLLDDHLASADED